MTYWFGFFLKIDDIWGDILSLVLFVNIILVYLTKQNIAILITASQPPHFLRLWRGKLYSETVLEHTSECDCVCFTNVYLSETEPKDAGSEKSSGVVRLNTIRQIIEQVWYNKRQQLFEKNITPSNAIAFFLRTVTLFLMWLLKPWTLLTTHSGIPSSSSWTQTASKGSKPWEAALCPVQVEAPANSMSSR